MCNRCEEVGIVPIVAPVLPRNRQIIANIYARYCNDNSGVNGTNIVNTTNYASQVRTRLKTYCSQHNYLFIDICTDCLFKNGYNAAYFDKQGAAAEDVIHPNEAGAKAIGEFMAESIHSMISKYINNS